jgi:MOSC domain-containing protein YiiM
MGTIEHIHIAHEASSPMMALSEAEVIAGQGIKGDRYASKVGHYSADARPGRHITLIEAEVIEEIAQVRGIPFAPHESRRNITTRGIRLNPLVGKTLHLGPVVLHVVRLCEPCVYLQELLGRPVLEPLVNRGGIRCDVVSGGIIRVGDPIKVVE